jgi:hypothetical protein
LWTKFGFPFSSELYNNALLWDVNQLFWYWILDLKAYKQALKYSLYIIEDKSKENEAVEIGPSQYYFIHHYLDLAASSSSKMCITLL